LNIHIKKDERPLGQIEFVERKGAGHPDTVCDRASEELSMALSRYYLDNFGRVLHHNVDKCVLVGGRSEAYFGGGRVIEPMYLLLVGRAITKVDGAKEVPVKELAQDVTKGWLKKSFRFLDPEKDIRVDTMIRPGSADLVKNFNSANGVPLANDTSFAVGYAPLSDTEKLVLQTERLLNSERIKKELPAIGEDIKVMGMLKEGGIKLTIASAMISSQVKGEEEYMEVKREVTERVLDLSTTITKSRVAVDVNTADNSKEKNFYLTVTGTSAENGDDGQVGRGNRANGLITPFRPMTLEATAGKNPVNHTGKIYNVTAQRIADKLVKEEPRIERAYVYILSQIGKPITEPQSLYLEVQGDISEDKIKSLGRSVAEEELSKLPTIWKTILDEKLFMF
jgi:S-adenosylmethionine synthetase